MSRRWRVHDLEGTSNGRWQRNGRTRRIAHYSRRHLGHQAVLPRPLPVRRRPDDEQPIVAQVMPAAGWIVGQWQSFALARRAPGVRRHAGERTHVALDDTVWRGDDSASVEPCCAVESLGRGEHDRMEDRRSPRNSSRRLERRAIEVADPHADGDVPGVADGPVVVIRLGGTGLHGDGEREFEASAASEDVFTGAIVGEDVGDPVSGQRRDIERRVRLSAGTS